MSKGLNVIAKELESRIQFFKTDEKTPRQGVRLEGVFVKIGEDQKVPAVAYGKDMRAATKALATLLRGRTVFNENVIGFAQPIEVEMPDEIDPRQYK